MKKFALALASIVIVTPVIAIAEELHTISIESLCFTKSGCAMSQEDTDRLRKAKAKPAALCRWHNTEDEVGAGEFAVLSWADGGPPVRWACVWSK